MTNPPTPTDRWTELERLAKAAAAGPWSKSRGLRGGYSIDADEREVVASDEFGRFGAIEVEEDAAFIAAANPSAILDLITSARSGGGYNDGFRDGQAASALARSVGGDVVELREALRQIADDASPFDHTGEPLHVRVSKDLWRACCDGSEALSLLPVLGEGLGSSLRDTHRANADVWADLEPLAVAFREGAQSIINDGTPSQAGPSADYLLHAAKVIEAACAAQPDTEKPSGFGVDHENHEALREKVARLLCKQRCLDPDEHIIGGQATNFEDFGPRWKAARKGHWHGFHDYEEDADAILAVLQSKGGEP